MDLSIPIYSIFYDWRPEPKFNVYFAYLDFREPTGVYVQQIDGQVADKFRKRLLKLGLTL